MKRFTKKDAQLIAWCISDEGLDYTIHHAGSVDDLLQKVPAVWEAVLEYKRAYERLSARLEDAGVDDV